MPGDGILGHRSGDASHMPFLTIEPGYQAVPLLPQQVDQAFPLVSTIAPELARDRWAAFARGMLDGHGDPPRGIVSLQNRRGYITGLFTWAVEPHLRHGRTLTVANFVVLDLFNLDAAADQLIREMESLARRHACTAIHTELPEAYSNLAESAHLVLSRFRDEGHQLGTLHFCKELQRARG
jgi:hypothetical protein